MTQVLPVLTKNIRQLKSWIEIMYCMIPTNIKENEYHAAKADYDRRPTHPPSTLPTQPWPRSPEALQGPPWLFQRMMIWGGVSAVNA